MTAARRSEPVGDSAASVAVLDAGALAVTAASRLDDALRQVPGFTLFRRTGSRTANPTTQGASLRGVGGSGASRALVLDDGLPLNDPFGGWVAWGRVPRLAVDRIEVLRGGSSMYGTSALSGVVQMVRKPDDVGRVDVEASAGSESTTEASFFAAGRRSAWSGSIAGESYVTDGFIPVAPEERGEVDTPAGSTQRVLDLTGGRRLGDTGRVFLRASVFREERDNGTRLQTNATDYDQAAAGWDGRLGGEARLRAYVARETYDQTFTSVAPDRSSEVLTREQTVPSRAAGFLGQWARSLSERTELLAGLEATRVSGESRETLLVGPGGVTVTGGRQVDLSAFADGRARLGQRGSITAGLRFDRWSNRPDPAGTAAGSSSRTESSWNPRISWRYQATGSAALTGSLWRAFRAPTLNELYRSFQAGGIVTQANDALGPERLTGAEAGLALDGAAARVRSSTRLFWMEVDDAVVNVTLPSDPTGATRRRENVARTRSRGLELDLAAPIGRRWTATAAYLFADAVVVDPGDGPAVEGARIPQVPRHQGTVQIRYDGPRGLRAGAQARWSGPVYEDDRNTLKLGGLSLLDLFASVPLVARLEAFVAAENVLDARYETGRTPVTTLGAPRLVRAGIRFTWSPGP